MTHTETQIKEAVDIAQTLLLVEAVSDTALPVLPMPTKHLQVLAASVTELLAENESLRRDITKMEIAGHSPAELMAENAELSKILEVLIEKGCADTVPAKTVGEEWEITHDFYEARHRGAQLLDIITARKAQEKGK